MHAIGSCKDVIDISVTLSSRCRVGSSFVYSPNVLCTTEEGVFVRVANTAMLIILRYKTQIRSNVKSVIV